MSCSQTLRHLDDYVDGTLPTKARRKVDEHLAICAACQRELSAVHALLAAARGLPADVDPQRDLWPGIEARLPSVRSTPFTASRAPAPEGRPWLQWVAAGLALLVLAVPLSVWWVDRQDGEGVTGAAASPDSGTLTARAQLARSEDRVQLARSDLIAAIERHRDVIEDDALEVLEENMRLIDRAIGEIRLALDEDPQNRRLRLLLANRYRQERKLLHSVSQV